LKRSGKDFTSSESRRKSIHAPRADWHKLWPTIEAKNSTGFAFCHKSVLDNCAAWL